MHICVMCISQYFLIFIYYFFILLHCTLLCNMYIQTTTVKRVYNVHTLFNLYSIASFYYLIILNLSAAAAEISKVLSHLIIMII